MEIREADTGDVRKVVEKLWLPLAREMEEISDYNRLSDGDIVEKSVNYRRSKMREGKYAVFYGVHDGEMIGFVAVDIKKGNPIFERNRYGVITDLYVDKKHRRKGYAFELMEKAEEFLENNDIDVVQLEVNVRNQSAVGLYSDLGYEKERYKMVKDLE